MLVFFILAILCVAFILTNPNTRQSILNSLNGNINNAEAQVYDDGSVSLTDDSAVVSSVAIVNKVTGTGPFDNNDEPGNDSSATNNIVRSFDTVTYELEANMAVNNTDHGSEDGNTYSSFRGGIINVEASIPKENAGTMKWSIDDMAWTEGTGKLSEDGLTFTGQYKLDENKITVPGKQTLDLVLKVEGAGNGTNLKPTFKLWIQGNEADSSNEGYEAIEITDNSPVTVSAKAGFNIKLTQGSRYQVKTSVDFDDGNGEVSGRMYGYGVILQLYNPDTEKGLKGLEYPKGDITFDIETKLEAVETIDGKQVTTDITDLATPKLWNYKINVGDIKENPAYGNIPDRNMYFRDYTAYDDGYNPYGMERDYRQDGAVYNSGNILMQEDSNVIHTTINSYEFNGKFPKYNDYYIESTSIVYGENIGCFSVGYFQIFVPDNDETLKARDYYLTVEDKNMVVNSVSNQEVTNQVVTNDDTNRVQHYISRPGKYNHLIKIFQDEEGFINNSGEISKNGKARVSKNQNIKIGLQIQQYLDNDIGTEIKSVNKLVKFDGDGLEPILYDDGDRVKYSNIDKVFKTWYVTKKDGTNWIDETERNNANIEDLNIYENLEDIPNEYICVGMYFESQEEIINVLREQYIMIRVKIKDTAEIGKTYGIVQDDDYWNVVLDRSTQTATNPDAVYPEPVWSAHNQQYVQTQYDENGEIITGTHYVDYSWGNTVLVVGADSSIGVKAIDEDSGAEKVTYDLGRNENVVTLQTTPTLKDLDSQVPSGITGATVRIKETLPVGLTYVPGSSNYGEPIDRIENSDGSITYIWDIYDCDVGEEIEPLVIKAEIDSDITNGTTLSVTSVIEPDRELIGLSSLELRTASTGIQVVNLSSHSLTKDAETRIIENNGEITYKVTYQNKTDYSMPDFQLLDILPYNGDGRGSAYNGTYTLKDVKVTQTAGGSSVSNDNLSLYTTTNVDARKITPKDEGIGVSEIWNEKEIGSSIEEPVTVLALKGEIAPNTRVEMEITLKTNNNRGGDTYSNSVTAQTSKDTEVINSTNAQTTVVRRQIEGMVWYDTNENGVKDNDESYANRVEVELLKSDGTKAVDVNGNEVPNLLTNENGEYSFTNLPMGEYIVKIYTEDSYKLTTANVGSNMEINSKFEETEGNKQSYVITNLNGIQSPEIIEENVNAGLVVKDAKLIVHYLEEDNTPNDDSDNKKLLEDKEITQHEVDGEMKNYKLGDSYSTEAAQIENYITLRNSGNTSGIFESEVVEVTYYYTYNKQDITVRKVWEDNSNEAQKRPTSIKVELKNGNNVVQEVVLSNSNVNSSNSNIWETTLNNLDIYDKEGQKINYTVDEKENEGTLENYNKTIEGYTITNIFTQNTEKINIKVNKVWNDNDNYAGKRPEELTLILKQEMVNGQERSYQEVTRKTINGTDNKGSNDNEWAYTFSGVSKYDQYNNEINYIVEEETPDFYISNVEKVENEGEDVEFKITNTFSVPDEKISIPVTKVWSDNNNRAGKRPTSVTLVLTGKNKEGNVVGEAKKITLTSVNAVEGNTNTWQGTIGDLPKYDEKADEINYELSEELDSIFYTQENATINQETKTITNRFVVPSDTIEIEVSKVWDDNNNAQNARPESVTLYLTGNSQEYSTVLTADNETEENGNTWKGTISNLPKYDVNGNEITYTLDERPIASEFYTKTNVDQASRTVTNRFAIPTESIQVPVTKVWQDNGNSLGKRPQTIELQIKNKETGDIVATQIVQGNSTTDEGWSYTFEVPKYGDTTDEIEYEIGEKDLENVFYTTSVDQENRTITNTFNIPDEKVVVDVSKTWVDTAEQQDKRPSEVTVVLKGGEIERTYNLKEAEDWKYTFTGLPKYDNEANEINYTVEEVTTNEFYTNTSVSGDMTSGYTITNTFTRPEDTVNVTVNKVWSDNNNEAQKRPTSVTLKLEGNGVTKTQEVTESNAVNGDTNKWSYTFTGLDKYDENGNVINYTADEEDVGSIFYEKDETIAGDMTNGYTITNRFVVPNDKVSVDVSKTWVDTEAQQDKRPSSVTVILKNGTSEVGRKELNVENGWKETFDNLAKYDSLGNIINYTVEEKETNVGELKFYTNTGITGDMNSGYVITNTFTRPEDTITVIGNKVWNDNEEQANRRPGSITLVVKNGDKEVQSKVVSVSDLVEGTTNKWSVEFEGLDKYDENGDEIKYTLEEKETNTGDLKFYQAEENNVAIEDNQATIRNNFVRPEDTVDVQVTKIWDDQNDKYGKRPASVYLIITGNGQSYKHLVTSKEEWTHTFEELPKYDDNGKEILYTAGLEEVNEGDLEFYSPEVTTGGMQEGYEIESGFRVPDDTIELTVNKVWQDNSIQSQRRPDTVVINVLGEEGSIVATYDLDVAGGEESYTFTDLQKYNSENGKEINYTVEEAEKNPGDLHFYTTVVGSVTTLDENSKEVTITNKFVKPNDTTNVTVTKVWDDNNDEASKRPESVKLLLKDGTETIREQEVTGDTDTWSYTFEGVAKYDDNGQEKVYTVDEEEVNPGDLQFYDKNISGLTVTNTFTQDTSTVDIPVTKVWEDNEVQSARRPSSVIVVLKANGEEEARQEITGTGDTWNYTFEDLPKYDEYNNIINYTVEEVEKTSGDLKFYSSSVDGYTITNTFTRPEDTVSLTVNKVWEDQENVYNKRPLSIRVNVRDSKGLVQTTIITKDNKWEHTFTNLPKYDENGVEIVYTVDEEEVIENDMFYYSGTAGSVSKVSENSLSATITNKMIKIPGVVTVKYVDKNTGLEISDATIKEGVVDNTFDISGDVKEIEGYTLIEEPPVKTGNYSPENQEFIYYYAKNTNVIVKYLEKDDTEDDNTDNVKLAEEQVVSGYEGLAYNVEDKKLDIEGYTLVGDSGNLSGTMTREGIEVIYYYSKNTSVVVKYLEKDNTPTDTSDNEVLLPEKTINGYVGKDYTTIGEEIPGYTLVEKTTNFEGVMTEDVIKVVYYYLKDTRVTVRYLEKDNTESDSDNKELVPDIIIDGYVGKDYETEQKQISGYTFVEVKGETSGKMTEDKIEVVYYYAQNTSVKVQHIDRETNEILAEEKITGKVGDVAYTQAKDIDGYVMVQAPSNPNVVMTKDEQVVKYYYAHVSGGVIEKHIDEITGNVIESSLHEGNEGDSYDISSKEFSGYDLVTDKLPTNSSGTMKRDEVIEVKYYYIKKAKVVVSYVDESTGEKISEDTEINGHENDNYTTESKDISGYSLVGNSGNTSGKMVVTVNEDGTFNIETQVTYYYKKIAGGVIVNHIDVATGEVLDNEKYDGNVGDSYETSSKDISGYDLVIDRLPNNASGTMTEEEIVVNYYYEKRASIRVEHIDKLTGEKLDEEEITGHVGDEYTTEEKEFSGYDLIEKPSNATGEMKDEEIVVKYYYARKAEVEIKYIEKETGYEITESDIINGYVGDSYQTEGKEVPYYNLIEKTENWEGTMTEEKITVIYYYEKQTFNLGVDKWLGSVSVNGISSPAQSITSSNEMYKVDVHRSKADTADIKITYKIRITNKGEVEGTVGKITDIIPAGTTFNQEDNNIYWDNNNGILSTDDLSTEVIKPGEYKEIEVTLRVNPGSENFGQKDNMVILTEISNPAGFQDADKEDNHDTSSMILTIATGLDRNDRIVIIGIVQIVLAISIGLLLSYKKKEKHND